MVAAPPYATLSLRLIGPFGRQRMPQGCPCLRDAAPPRSSFPSGILHHSPLNSNERKELLVGEVPTGEQLFYLSFDEFREWGVVGVVRARAPFSPLPPKETDAGPREDSRDLVSFAARREGRGEKVITPWNPESPHLSPGIRVPQGRDG